MNGWLIALALLAAHVVVVYILVRTGRLAKWNMSLMLGIVLMLRTQRGRKLIDALARPKRAWNAMGDLGTALTLLGMAAMTVLFLWSVVMVLQPNSPIEPLSASEILVIPGVNPFVPLWYGIVALIVTLVVHEAGHGILARANGMRLKSMGILWAVVPIGAFVEPDDLDLKVAPRRNRLRVFAAGPAVNMSMAAVCLLLFAGMVGAAATAPGVHVFGPARGSPAHDAGIAPGETVRAINGVPMTDEATYVAFATNLTAGDPLVFTMASGVERHGTAGRAWDRFTAQQQDNITAGTAEGQAICARTFGADGPQGSACAEALVERSFIGIIVFDRDDVGFLQAPFSHGWIGFASLISLPIGEVRQQPILSLMVPSFYEAPWGGDLYWVLATMMFWLFWLNLMVGLTNMLPMLPLDGGHVFRDVVGGVVDRVAPRATTERREKIVGRWAGIVSLVILGAFLLQIFGPYLVQ